MIASAQSIMEMPSGLSHDDVVGLSYPLRENGKDETEYEGKVNTAMHHFRQKAETRSVIVEDGKCDQQRANDAGCERSQRAKTNLGVEFLFKLARLGFIQFHGRQFRLLLAHHTGLSIQSAADPLESKNTLIACFEMLIYLKDALYRTGSKCTEFR